jgi:hypothetical protein
MQCSEVPARPAEGQSAEQPGAANMAVAAEMVEQALTRAFEGVRVGMKGEVD